MSFIKPHQVGVSASTSQSGMTAEQWLEARRNEQNQLGAVKFSKVKPNLNFVKLIFIRLLRIAY